MFYKVFDNYNKMVINAEKYHSIVFCVLVCHEIGFLKILTNTLTWRSSTGQVKHRIFRIFGGNNNNNNNNNFLTILKFFIGQIDKLH